MNRNGRPIPLMATIGENVKAARKSAGLTQAAVTEAIGKKSTYIWNVEHARMDNLPLIRLVEIAEVLGVNYEVFLGMTDSVQKLKQQVIELQAELNDNGGTAGSSAAAEMHWREMCQQKAKENEWLRAENAELRRKIRELEAIKPGMLQKRRKT